MRRHLTYANIMATLAMFLALAGTSYAVTTITSANIKDGTIQGKDLSKGLRQAIALALTDEPTLRARLITVPASAQIGSTTGQATCPSGYKLSGGGGWDEYASVVASAPVGNSWHAGFRLPGERISSAFVYAICLDVS